jgi:hypothetical protein
MSRKPVNEINALQTRAALWAAIRRLSQPAEGAEALPTPRPFTSRTLRYETRCTLGQVQEYLTGLVNAGILSRQAGPVGPEARTYTLVRDLGIESPRVRRDGTPSTQGLGREQMWRTMRMLKDFTALDLSVQASTEVAAVGVGTAQEYCKFLARAGYLAVIRAGHGTGKGGISTRYRFVQARNTGPQPPMIQKVKQLFDPNLGAVVWSSAEGDHDAE